MEPDLKARLRAETAPLLQTRNWNEIERLWKPFVQTGDVDAEGELGCLYEMNGFDEGPGKDREMRDLLQHAASEGHAGATYCLAVLARVGPEHHQLLIRAGELGNVAAQRDLGAFYATGDWSGPKDPATGLQWYARAARQGHPDAQYNLGFMYILGEGTDADPDTGLLWLNRSAEQGFTDAMRLLGDLHHNGYYNVPHDPVKAEFWAVRLRDATNVSPNHP